MTDYNDGKWHGWSGGECPVHPKTVVEIVYFEDGITHNEAICKYCDFSKNAELPIIAFRVIKEHKEPREFYARFLDRCDVWQHCSDEHPDAARFREVLE